VKKADVLEVTAINLHLKYTKVIFLLRENCVITGELGLVILRAVSKMTAF